MRMSAPAVAMVATVAVGMAVNAGMAMGVTMNAGMTVPLPMSMGFGLVQIGQRHADDDADRDPERQRALVIGPRGRYGQNPDEKRSEEDCAHLVPTFREASKPYAVRRPRSTGFQETGGSIGAIAGGRVRHGLRTLTA